MSCVTVNPVNCSNVRSITINQLNPDNTVSTVVIYFDIESGEQINERTAQQCPNIQPLSFSCAVVCDIA